MNIRSLIPFLAGLAFSLSQGQSQSLVLTQSGTAPASAYISQALFDGGVPGGGDYSDNAGPPGQSFLTLSSNVSLSAVTVKGGGVSGSLDEGNRFWVLTVSLVSSGTLTNVAQGVTNSTYITNPNNNSDYITLTLTTPVELNANTLYSFDIYTSDSNDLDGPASANGGYFGFAKSASDAYLNGNPLQHGSTARLALSGDLVTGAQSGTDRTFFIEATVVPEPSTCLLLAVAGLLGLVVLPRRHAAA